MPIEDFEARLGSVTLGGPIALAEMTSAHGDWYLKKDGRVGWDLWIEARTGEHAGWFIARGLLFGGTISLTDGVEADLRWSGISRWTLQLTDPEARLAEFRAPGLLIKKRTAVALWPYAETAASNLLVLTALAVLMLKSQLDGFAPPVYAGG